jgi:alpha-beta hydrolase superfamily lysophospholipase
VINETKGKALIFLSGSSFGGSIAFKMSLRAKHKYAGIIFLAPALREVS